MNVRLITIMLYLLPNLLSPTASIETLPLNLQKIIPTLDGFIAESQKGLFRFLSHFKMEKKLNQIPYSLLNEHTKPTEYDFLLEPLVNGENWGILSDGGLPTIADPGASLVHLANIKKIPIEVISGPSSIFYALLLSGFPAQKFMFHGYPPRRDMELWLKEIEKKKYSNLFIEAPYRNIKTLETLLSTLKPSTNLFIGCDLTGPDEFIKTLKVHQWKKNTLPDIHKKPAIFLIYPN
ncbi:SAM-dependent methyltransferase [Chlamydiales bacterium]|nr:SAM-dependent methyltransferase [Chlamydiales bacterium]